MKGKRCFHAASFAGRTVNNEGTTKMIGTHLHVGDANAVSPLCRIKAATIIADHNQQRILFFPYRHFYTAGGCVLCHIRQVLLKDTINSQVEIIGYFQFLDGFNICVNSKLVGVFNGINQFPNRIVKCMNPFHRNGQPF